MWPMKIKTSVESVLNYEFTDLLSEKYTLSYKFLTVQALKNRHS